MDGRGEDDEEEAEEKEATNIKSYNPHLAGGELGNTQEKEKHVGCLKLQTSSTFLASGKSMELPVFNIAMENHHVYR